MFVFVLGGVKCGKSMLSQCTARYLNDISGGRLFYLATMQPHDEEDEKRIARHLEDRSGWGFETIEEPSYIPAAAERISSGDTVLIDSVTAYVQNIMFGDDDIVNNIRIADIHKHFELLCAKGANVIAVSDYIFSDAIIYTDMSERYRAALGRVHKDMAECADVVIECAYSNAIIHKNEAGLDISPILSEFRKLDSHLQYADI